MTDRDRTTSDITARLDSMGVMDEPEIVVQLLQSFLDSAKSLRKELSEAIVNEDLQTSRAAAHTLKGSTRNLSAHDLADLCTAIEAELNVGPLEDSAESMDRLDAELSIVTDIVKEMMTQARGG